MALYVWSRVSDCRNLAPPAASVTISFHLAWRTRLNSRCSRDRMPALWRQKGQVPAADFRRLPKLKPR